MMLRRNRGLIENGITQDILKSCIKEHQTGIARLNRLDDYYKGKHDILKREAKGEGVPNNKLVCNFPKYITDTATGYMFGNAVIYKSPNDKDIANLTALFSQAESNTHDAEMGKDLSVFGEAFELVYMSSDEIPVPKLAIIDPGNAFVVYDDTVEVKPMFGVTYQPTVNAKGENDGYLIAVYDDSYIYNYKAKTLQSDLILQGTLPNVFGILPITQYWNNEEGMGDFESVMTLIDAYNVLQSDRVNDKQRFVEAILMIKNATLETDENGKITPAALEMLRNGIMILPGANDAAADASYLTKVLNESEVEILKDSIVSDIHKFSQIPDFSDEQFAGNNSGVALAYKLLSLEYLAKVKERFFTSGLKARIKLFSKYLDIKARPPIDTAEIAVSFNRKLPVNDLEVAQIIQLLAGKVSNETLLTLLSFVKDIPAEIVKIQAEQEEKAKLEAEAIKAGGY